MNYTFKQSPEFEKQAKRLNKRYPSFMKDFLDLLVSLKENPFQGVDLGSGIRKIRMQITSKGKGKSAGARVITLNVNVDIENMVVAFLYIYDKSEMQNVSDRFLQQIIKNIGL